MHVFLIVSYYFSSPGNSKSPLIAREGNMRSHLELDNFGRCGKGTERGGSILHI